MTLEEYQDLVRTTSVFPSRTAYTYCTLGLCGEAGEVAEKVKKHLRGDGVFDKANLAKELGDVAWYVTALGSYLGYSLEDILQMNADKLLDRKTRGVLKGNGDNR